MPAQTLEGTIERITYYNEENGYGVIRLKPSAQLSMWTADGDGLVTVVGTLPEVNEGEYVHLEGDWATHPRHGRQFKAEIMRSIRPPTVEGMRRYLGSGLIKGIGPKLAARIIDHFGADTFDILDSIPQRLMEVAGIGTGRTDSIITAWEEQRAIKDVMIFLQAHGITTTLAHRIYKQYKDNSIALIESDPYRLSRDIWGIGFKTADRIARSLGLPSDHPTRLEAGLSYALNQATDEGHIYQPDQTLMQAAAELLEVPPDLMPSALERAAATQQVIVEPDPQGEGRAVYLPMYQRAEVGSARQIAQMLAGTASRLERLQGMNPASIIAESAAQADVELSEQQQGAVLTAIQNPISVLTGGPGTGKTTTLRALIAALQAGGHSFALASPTGRAAKRLNEATGQPARTIHRLLGFSPSQGWMFNEENPLPVDMVIIDETSMLDAMLAYALLRAVNPGTHLLLVGDVNQLPSVGAGDVLRDLIASALLPVTRLDVIFRQSAQSTIISNAHRINKGEMPAFPDGVEDFFLFSIPEDVEQVAAMVVEVVSERIPRRFGLHPLDDVQVLVPMYRGAAGVQSLNQKLQETLNPPARRAERLIGGRLYREGDKVLQTRNNYDKEVFNGDVGRIQAIDLTEQIITVKFEDRSVNYDFSEAPELIHAYAISVHRSQGSEYPAIVMPVVTGHFMMLQRNLLYTAVTRARKLVVLVGSKKAIAIAVKNNKVSQRFTSLAARLRGEL
jgi:exodeoxyribonuclease V alpha subunit